MDGLHIADPPYCRSLKMNGVSMKSNMEKTQLVIILIMANSSFEAKAGSCDILL
jgi:hypothetical protein